MKKYINIFLAFTFFISSVNCNKYITYDTHPLSLLGDRLIEFSIAKWISWKYKLPFLYQPFPPSDLFVFHEKEYYNQSLLETCKQNKTKIRYFSHNSFNKETLYTVRINYSHDRTWNEYDNLIDQVTLTQTLSMNPKLDQKFEYEGREKGGYFDYLFIASRKDPHFLSELKKLISPKQKITYLNLPKDKVSVAMHIRLGGIFEQMSDGKHYGEALKRPPLDYYIDQLKRLSIFLGNVPLFVYIFTNHSDPSILTQEIKKEFTEFNNITFASRTKNNQKETTIEDLFLMSKFDCLIRPNSSFSMSAQLIGNHKIIISPKRGFWHDKKLYIDKIGMIIMDQNLSFITPPTVTSSDIQKITQKLKKF